MNYIIVLIILFLIGIWYKNKDNKYIKYILPFQKFSKCKLILVKGFINNKFTFFLVDTGASSNFLDCNQFNADDFKKVGETSIATVGNKESGLPIIKADIEIEKEKSCDNFILVDLSNNITNIEASTGITISGIIGSEYILKNKWIIDYRSSTIIKFY